ncbi:50S ribosomal protein L21 [Alteripontixanthobacter maritimus]|uniref:50S ribosomal protein L21 n=1 Tax=Alteripontixanthobacter maritimus TaxID=2161824 RepID=A0A369Q989_9SPHN|nr:helix-hairpin-helix domain-containing protein [Alteripontixanthobacter maritimus]RDC59479.1 50S ribosomal protein L21 [Alteripontixanthobacter maritimus]
MIELVQTNWPLLVAALVIGLLVAWWLFVALRRTKVETTRTDVLDEGADAAARNQALIDAPPASAVPTGLAGTAIPATVAARQVAGAPVGTSAPAATDGDDLTRMKGVGPKLAMTLRGMGITTFAQIAAWTDADVARIDGQLGRFAGRIERDDWRTQARYLADNDEAGFRAKFGAV